MLFAAVTLATTARSGIASESPQPGALPSEIPAHLDSVIVDLDGYSSDVLRDGYSTPRVVPHREGDVPDTPCPEGTTASDWVKGAFLPSTTARVYDADAHAATSWTLGMGKISGATLSVGNDGPIDQAVTGRAAEVEGQGRALGLPQVEMAVRRATASRKDL